MIKTEAEPCVLFGMLLFGGFLICEDENSYHDSIGFQSWASSLFRSHDEHCLECLESNG